ncbi:MAG: DoxX family protein [Ferruginibacter sp.]|nr:DoxX family protein [Chitinophagaceae bacterium]
MKNFPFIDQSSSIKLLRIITSLMLAAHGCVRLYAGTVNGFGGFLNSKGFVIGVQIAWFLTIFEMAGGLLMAAGYFRRWIAAVFIIQLVMGIILVHADNGWFVVGYQSGGVEYSVLLIIVLILISSNTSRYSVTNS